MRVRHPTGLGIGVVAAVFLVTAPQSAKAQFSDEHIYTFVQLDQLEYRRAGSVHPVAWEMLGWVGGDFNRLWFKSEGERATVGTGTDVEVQVLYGRLIAPFWDLQVGLRFDAVSEGGRTDARVFVAFGFEGLAPYWFEVEPAFFVSQDGDVSARVTSSYDVFVTQRLIAQPRIEIDVAVQDVPEFGVGSGLTEAEFGFRLRYEFTRKTAPYVGINWRQLIGATATMARATGDDTSEFAMVGGVRVWF